jgi:hypothetical protein
VAAGGGTVIGDEGRYTPPRILQRRAFASGRATVLKRIPETGVAPEPRSSEPYEISLNRARLVWGDLRLFGEFRPFPDGRVEVFQCAE